MFIGFICFVVEILEMHTQTAGHIICNNQGNYYDVCVEIEALFTCDSVLKACSKPPSLRDRIQAVSHIGVWLSDIRASGSFQTRFRIILCKCKNVFIRVLIFAEKLFFTLIA